ncbi:MAG: hypothetical protein F6K47_29690, partial [Symploca sp. SIO2E6]|nr:hypothetical protein [Symploca sp. SIO2E6]
RKFKIDDTDGLHLVLSAGVKGVTLSKFNQFLVDQLDLEWLKKLLQETLGATDDLFAQVLLTKLDIDRPNQELSFGLEITNVWHIYKFELTDIHLNLKLEIDKKTVVDGDIALTLNLGSTACGLQAVYQDKEWRFTGKLVATAGHSLSLYDGLHHLADKVDLDNVVDSLPQTFQDLQIKTLDIAFTPHDKYFDFDITLEDDDGRWAVIPGLFEIGPATLDLEIIESHLFGEIDGSFLIGDTELRTKVDFPAFRGEVKLADDTSLSISQILKQVHVDAHGLDKLQIDAFHVLYDSPGKHAIVYLELSGTWNDGLVEFNLKDASLDLDYLGGDGGGLSAKLLAQMSLDIDSKDISLAFSAEHPGPGEGWQIAAIADLDDTVNISHIFEKYAHSHLDFVDAFLDWSITHLEISYDTKAKHFVASMEAVWHHDDKSEVPETILSLKIEKKTDSTPAKSSISVSGQLLVKGLEFDLIFNTEAQHTSVIGSFSNPAGGGVDVEQLITGLIGVEASDFPLKSFKIKDAVLAYEKSKTKTALSKMLFLIDMDAGIDLSGLGNLPVVGSAFSSESRLGIAFTPIYATKNFSKEELEAITPNMPSGTHSLTEAEGKKGFHLALDVQLGGVAIPTDLLSDSEQKSLPGTKDDPNNGLGSSQNQSPPVTPPAPTTDLKWIEVQKHLGPIHVQRLGLGYEKPTLKFAIDASLVFTVLSLRLYGLGASYNTTTHDLGFSIKGMGLDLNKGPAKISADFLDVDGDFVGQASLSMSEFALAAMGGFTLIDHQPSLFIYAFLDYPLGGPVFFFVEGIAAGFGINRHVTMPAFDKVHEFPFVAEVLKTMPPPMKPSLPGKGGKSSVQDDLDNEMVRLHQYISPKLGDYFLTAGLRFSSFELLHCFALLLLSFSLDGHVELDLLGIVQLSIPPDPEPEKTAFLELELIASLDFTRGIFSFCGNITDRSFLMSPNSKISGGFAAIFWFKDDTQTKAEAGDFVVTVGGYHSQFKRPDYYPLVKRLQFTWPIVPSVNGKGTLYFALVPSGFMAGGLFELSWSCGLLWAYLKVGADFLIIWKPLHYQAKMYIEIGVGAEILGIRVSATIGADLKIWGPEFSGRADFDFKIVTFHVDFGHGKPKLPPLSWAEFKASFLPKAANSQELAQDKLLSFAVTDGLIKQLNDHTGAPPSRWIVNPKHFVLNVDCLVPLSAFTLDGKQIKDNPNIDTGDDLTIGSDVEALGILPMQVTNPTSTLDIAVAREGVLVPEEFSFRKTIKNFPAALWGQGKEAGEKTANGKRLIKGVGALTLKPAKLPLPGTTSSIERRVLDYELYPKEITDDPIKDQCGNFIKGYQARQTTISRRDASLQQQDQANRQVIHTALRSDQANSVAVKERRDRLLTYLGFNPAETVRLTDALEKDFIVAPMVLESNK